MPTFSTQARNERIRRRSDDARHTRHAGVLRRFWHTHSGVTLPDLFVLSVFLAGTFAIAHMWRAPLFGSDEKDVDRQRQAQRASIRGES